MYVVRNTLWVIACCRERQGSRSSCLLPCAAFHQEPKPFGGFFAGFGTQSTAPPAAPPAAPKAAPRAAPKEDKKADDVEVVEAPTNPFAALFGGS